MNLFERALSDPVAFFVFGILAIVVTVLVADKISDIRQERRRRASPENAFDDPASAAFPLHTLSTERPTDAYEITAPKRLRDRSLNRHPRVGDL